MFIKYKMTSLVAFLGLIGCATSPPTAFEMYQAGATLPNVPYKAGVNAELMTNEKTDCEIEVEQRVPRSIVVSTTPTYTSPVSSQCNQIGTQTLCTQIGGDTYGGRTSSTDANADLRQRAYNQCMVNKNYRFINLPVCPQGSVPSNPQASVLPPLTPTTCYQFDEYMNFYVLNY